MSPFRPHGCPTWSIHAAAPAPPSGVVMDQTSTASWSTPGKWKSIRKFRKKEKKNEYIYNYLYDIMLPPTSMEVENDHFTKESALRLPLGPAFASSEMCLQSSPFTTPASSKCQSQRSWKCNLLKVVTMTNMAYYFPLKVQQLTSWPPKLLMLKSEVSTLDLLEDLHSRKNCGNLPLIHFVALRTFLNTVQFTLFLASWSVFP